MQKTNNLLRDLYNFLHQHISGSWDSTDLSLYLLDYTKRPLIFKKPKGKDEDKDKNNSEQEDNSDNNKDNSDNKDDSEQETNTTKTPPIDDSTVKRIIFKLMKNNGLKNKFDTDDAILKAIYKGRTKITNIYDKHQISYDNKMETGELIRNLLYICLSENVCKFAPFYHRKTMTPNTFKATIGRDSNAEKLKELLDQHRKIIISGKLGSGKTHFIKYCLKKWNLKNFCYIDYDYNFNQDTHSMDEIVAIQTTLNKIEYSDSEKNIYRGSYHELENDVFLSSLLVIDNMYLSDEELDRVLNWLAELKPMIIVLSMLPAKTSSFYPYELPCLSDDDLLQIFETTSGFSIQKNQSLQEQTLMVSGRNILIISLIAKLYPTLKQPKAEWLTKILDYLSYTDNSSKIKEATVTYKHSYDKESLTVVQHLKKFYTYFLDASSYTKNSILCTYMKWLSCFGSSSLPLNFISCIIPDFQETYLKKLHDLGFITINDDIIQLSPSIAYAVFEAEKPYSILTAKKYPYNKNLNSMDIEITRFNLIFDKLTNFLKTYDETLSVPYLSTALFTFAKSLYPKVPTKYNPNQQTTSKNFEKWQDFLYLIQNYYNQNGEYLLSKEVAHIIFYPDDSKNIHNPLDKIFFECGNNIQLEDFIKNMPKQLEDLRLSIKENPEFFVSAGISSILNNTMDLIIGLFSTTSLLIVRNRNNFLEIGKLNDYQKTLLSVLQKIINIFPFLPKQAKEFTTTEKFYYYQFCYKLMSSLSATNVTHPMKCLTCGSTYCSEICKPQSNVNYHIRTTAFLLFMQSYDKMSIIQNPGKQHNNNLLISFNTYLMPKAMYLRNQIQNCSFIPEQTFRICLYAYIATSAVQHKIDKHDEQFIKTRIDSEFVKELINCSLLSKETADEAAKAIDLYF